MSPINPFKYIGIGLGVVVVGVVGLVTLANERSTPASAISMNAASSSTVAETVTTKKTSTKSPASTVVNTVSRWFSDDDGEGDDGGSRSTTATPTVVPPPATTPKNYVAVYKNGTYSANGTYNSPGGQDQISVSVTLVNDIITDATVTSIVADRTSQKYQNNFIAGYKQYVVGQNIANVNLTVVSGSSLTPVGFNNALTQIKVQAKA
jgi:hypothetical protein